MPEKQCKACGKSKSLNDFHKNGTHSYCKPCTSIKNAEWRKNNPQRAKDAVKSWRLEKLAVDPIFRMKQIYSRMVLRVLARRGADERRSSKIYEVLGIATGEELYRHMIAGFERVYGRFPEPSDVLDVDHIIPLAEAVTEIDIIRLNHYTNLRFLLRKDNRYIKRHRSEWSPKVDERPHVGVK